jgi:glycine/D-amino acid oxidase-like deaminating enzyme/nitrite reductase/ring-hydroxylating ferredoxin subunit
VSALYGLIYDHIRQSFGDGAARAYAHANSAALEWMAGRIEQAEIDCDFRRRPAFTYAVDAGARGEVEDEVLAARAASLPVEFTEEVPLPYTTAGAIRLDDQAEFHPIKYLLGLTTAFVAAGGRVFENSRATSVSEGVPCTVKTDAGSIVAHDVIIATHTPFLDRSLAFARTHAERSYCIAVAAPADPPDGMFLSSGGPTRSIRTHPGVDGELLIVGGEGHKSGQGGDTEARYARLEEFARKHFDVGEVAYRWSSQDLMPADGLPYVGAVNPVSHRLLMATGFAKWGLTNGTAAAMILTDRILGQPNPWASTFASNRVAPRPAARSLVTENADAARHMVGDRLTGTDSRSAEELAPGEGAVVKHDGEKVAAYRDDGGKLHLLSPTCTHLGCLVAFNPAERSWDCPCHGSRYGADGEVLEGPAVHALARKTEPGFPDPSAG